MTGSIVTQLLNGVMARVSTVWFNWLSLATPKRCIACELRHGTIYDQSQVEALSVQGIPPLHARCRCRIERLKAIYAGTATHQGNGGADWFLRHTGKLPDGYLTKPDAEKQGWKPKQGNLDTIAPGSSIGGDIYRNSDARLPVAPDRVWYEADINYTGGFRGSDRILYSNDGLVFVSFDHDKTFVKGMVQEATMRTILIDMSRCTHYDDLHIALQRGLDFPSFYGMNLDALWDCLTGCIDRPVTVVFRGIGAMPAELQVEMARVLEVFAHAEREGWGVHAEVDRGINAPATQDAG